MNRPHPRRFKRCHLSLLSILTLATAVVGEVSRAATPTPAPTAAPSAAPAAASPAVAAPPKYSGVQQSQYIATANAAFVAQRTAKFQAFMDARTAFEAAGGIVPKGLSSKATVEQRRELLSKVRTTNDDYLAFMTTQQDTYRAELAKTPLVPSDIDAIAADLAVKANIPRAIKLQTMEKDLLTCTDEMLGDLSKWDGNWSANAAGKLSFKKKSSQAEYVALEKKYNGIATDMQQLQTPAASPSPAVGPSPGASPSPAAAPPSATP